MVVDEDGFIHFAFTFCKDYRRSIRRHDFGFEATLFKHPFYKLGAFFQSQVLSADTGLGNIFFKLI